MTRSEGCCTSCKGTGYSGDGSVPGGKCWDCRGTGHDHEGDCAVVSTAMVGRCWTLGWQTLDELVAELQRLKESGTPGDATVHAAPLGSIAFAEVSWVGAPVHDAPRLLAVNHSKGCPVVDGSGVCAPCERQQLLSAPRPAATRAQMTSLLAESSIGEGVRLVRSSPFHCEVRDGDHTVSGAATAAEVHTTRCTSCRQRIRLEHGAWRSDDDREVPKCEATTPPDREGDRSARG